MNLQERSKINKQVQLHLHKHIFIVKNIIRNHTHEHYKSKAHYIYIYEAHHNERIEITVMFSNNSATTLKSTDLHL